MCYCNYGLLHGRTNILLDSGMNAKLDDFGFSMELPQLSHGKTMFFAPFITQSEGYYPSEVTSGHFSDRSDVYCFGVVSLMFGSTHPISLSLSPSPFTKKVVVEIYTAKKSSIKPEVTKNWQVYLNNLDHLHINSMIFKNNV